MLEDEFNVVDNDKSRYKKVNSPDVPGWSVCDVRRNKLLSTTEIVDLLNIGDRWGNLVKTYIETGGLITIEDGRVEELMSVLSLVLAKDVIDSRKYPSILAEVEYVYNKHYDSVHEKQEQ